MKKLMEVQNLEILFKECQEELKAVRDISFSIYEGETLALVGESGCGKSVTAKALMGLLPGKNVRLGKKSRILYKGENIIGFGSKRWRDYCGKECAMIFQDSMAALNPTLTIGRRVSENLLVHYKISKADALRKTIKALAEVGIPNPEERIKQYPHEFSGGMRQRSMVAMAMICHPKLLIADEPTTALDVTIQAQILELMENLKKNHKMSLLLITHDLGIVAGMADRTAVMYAGKLVETGNCCDIYYHPKHPYTSGLLNSVPRINAEKGTKMTAIKGMPPSLKQEPEGCAFVERCDHCMDICKKNTPPLCEFGEGHMTWCWLYDKTAENTKCDI